MNDSHRRISFARILGLGGVGVCLLGGFIMAGGNPWFLFVPSMWFAVLGSTVFALLATYGSDFVWFCGDALLALFSKRPPNDRYAEIARSGSRYALGAAAISFLLGSMITLANLDGPSIEEIGMQFTFDLAALLLGVILAGIVFPFLTKTYQAQDERPHGDGRSTFLLGLCVCGLPILCFFVFLIAALIPFSPGNRKEDIASVGLMGFPMSDLAVNVAGTHSTRILRVGLMFEVLPNVLKEMKRRHAEMSDAIAALLAAKRLEDLKSPDIRQKLRLEILAEVNRRLKSGRATKLHFTDLVVQQCDQASCQKERVKAVP